MGGVGHFRPKKSSAAYFWGIFLYFSEKMPDNFQNKAGAGGSTPVWKNSKNSSDWVGEGFPYPLLEGLEIDNRKFICKIQKC